MLEDKLYQRILDLCKAGDELAAKNQYEESLKDYLAAWELLPAPKHEWEAATWIQSAIGNAKYSINDYESCLQAFLLAVQSPGGLGNPFIHLRLGECYFELGNEQRAGDELARAYIGAGREIFADEPPKYLNFLKTILRPPEGQGEL
jgi:tetratricopeptide (TPR) repeat protein